MVLSKARGKLSLLLMVVGAVVVVSMAQASLAAGRTKRSGASTTNVAVMLGQPAEHEITLSTNHVPLGTVFFTVTNGGALSHNFKVCANPTGSTKHNDCDGGATSTLKPGDAAVLKVVFTQAGSFEYLSTEPGHASAGMRGLLNVGPKGQQNTSPAMPPEKLALARRVTQCMHSHGFPNYPDDGNSPSGAKPSAAQGNAQEQRCERQARKALGLA